MTEIGGGWPDAMSARDHLLSSVQIPGFSYPSDTNEVRPGLLLSADYVRPGVLETFDLRGRVHWRDAPTGRPARGRPSLALPLPNGDVVASDDCNHRLIVVDPRTDRVVWQYGHTGVGGRAHRSLDIPAGVDLAPPRSLTIRFGRPGLSARRGCSPPARRRARS